MDSSRVRLTYAHLLAMPEDGKRHELIDGEHHVSAAPTPRHQIVLRSLFRALDGYVRAQRLGEVLFAPVDVVLSESDVVEPDLLYVSSRRQALFEQTCIRGAPDLVVEVISPSTRNVDLAVKRRAYRKFGVAEYWIVDPELETVDIFRGAGDWLWASAQLRRAHPPTTLASPLFPGLAIPLDQIFA